MDTEQTRSACETLATSVAALLEDDVKYVVTKPKSGLRGYTTRAAALQRAGETIVILAMAAQAKGDRDV